MVHANYLAAKVAVVNNANKYALELYPSLRAIFEPFLGQKIEKADGTLLKKIAELIPDHICNTSIHVYRHTSDYSLAWVVKTNESYPNNRGDCHLAVYHETVVYVGHMRSGFLEKFYDAPGFRHDYTVEEIIAKREEYKIAKGIADKCLSALFPFGEYDR